MSLAGRAQLGRAWPSSGRAEKLGLDVQIYAGPRAGPRRLSPRLGEVIYSVY
jgi:hypothetical protein